MKPYRLTKRKYLQPEEYDDLVRLLANPKPSQFRNTVMLRLALATGARASELLNIEWDDVNERDRTVFIHGLKGSEDREIPIDERLMTDLMRLPKTLRPFPIGYNQFLAIWHFYRPVKKPLHSLRHTFAIRIYERTRDLRLVQVALGHRSISNTMIYAQFLYNKEEMRRLIL